MSSPIISVITPAYNADQFIAETIESVLAQTFSNWEMLIVDDGSVDDTATIIKKYANIDKRIKYLHQTNSKQGKARNLAIQHAKGEYLAFIDADDLWHPQKLEKQMEVFEANPNVDLIFTNGLVFKDNKDNVINTFSHPGGELLDQYIYPKMLNGYTFPNLSVITKKEKIIKLGGFCEDLRVQNCEDYQMWLRLVDDRNVVYCIDELLFYYRLHDSQVTANDSFAFSKSIWGVFLADLKRARNKNTILLKRVNRKLVHEISRIDKNQLKNILKLYKSPLKRFDIYILNKLLYLFGINTFKRFHYKFSRLKLLL
jgi:glycosyltransferase involved in cell wall biosynthesis